MAIATAVHAHQLDKGGMPYILHPLRISEKCSRNEEKIVALLHYTIEDGNITLNYLLQEGFPQEIVDAVLSVTKTAGRKLPGLCPASQPESDKSDRKTAGH